MGLIERVKARFSRGGVPAAAGATELVPNEGATGRGSSEVGRRATPEAALRYAYQQMWVDPDRRATILDVRRMDMVDGRVKRIHSRVARDVVKGGLVLTQPKESAALRREWERFVRRLQLDRVEKLKSDARGLVMEGNLPLQWVLDDATRVTAGVRMPSETIFPNVDANGRFKDVAQAFFQQDPNTAERLAVFPLWQLLLCRFDPDNFDDMGSLGRPFLDASRTVWRKLRMTEEDLVIRRRMRAPLRLAHVLEGAKTEELDDYRARVEADQKEITTDYFLNKKGGVQAIQGDAALAEIGDVVFLMDALFAGGPLPKGLMGYTDGMARDILEDLKRDYYEEVDVLQDTIGFAYSQGFRLHLLLQGMAPDPGDYAVGFAERRTETLNQTTDRMLKWQALGIPKGMIFEEMGFNAQQVKARAIAEAKDRDPYPGDTGSTAPAGSVPRISITPGNAPKGESAAAATHSNRLGEFWPGDA